MSSACVVGKITLDSSVRINGGGGERREEREGGGERKENIQITHV